MGQPDQFAKRSFAEDTGPLTAGGATWDIPAESGLSHVQGDGLLVVRRPGRLAVLPPPWSEASTLVQVLVELKMCRDRLDVIAFERAALRRQVRQVELAEAAREAKRPWPSQQGLWMSDFDRALPRRRARCRLAPCSLAPAPSP